MIPARSAARGVWAPLALAALIVCCVVAAPRAAQTGGSVAVETAGSVPGVAADDLNRFVTERMNKARLPAWQFRAAPASGGHADDRVEWAFKVDPSATGDVRTYGFSRAMMERLLAARHRVTIRVRLYLHGEYQTETLGQVTVGATAPDADLDAEILKLTQMVMSYPASADPLSRVAGNAASEGALEPFGNLP